MIHDSSNDSLVFWGIWIFRSSLSLDFGFQTSGLKRGLVTNTWAKKTMSMKIIVVPKIVHFSATSQTDPPSPPKNCCVNSAPLRCQYIIRLCLEWLDPHRSKSRPQLPKKSMAHTKSLKRIAWLIHVNQYLNINSDVFKSID